MSSNPFGERPKPTGFTVFAIIVTLDAETQIVGIFVDLRDVLALFTDQDAREFSPK
jgi:hypothetical protein